MLGHPAFSPVFQGILAGFIFSISPVAPCVLLPLNSCPPLCVSSFVSAISSCIASPCGTATIDSFPRVSVQGVGGGVECEADFAEGLCPRHDYLTPRHSRQVKIEVFFFFFKSLNRSYFLEVFTLL